MKGLKWKLALMILGIVMIALSGLEVSLNAQDLNPGQIQIQLEKSVQGREISGVEFSLYKVGDYQENRFIFSAPFQDCTLSPDQMNDSQAVARAVSVFSAAIHQPLAVQKTDRQGLIRFEGLEKGVYYARVSDPGSYERIEDMIFCLPFYNPKTGQPEMQGTVFAKPVSIPDVLVLKMDPDQKLIRNKEFTFSTYWDKQTTRLDRIHKGDPNTGIARFTMNLGQVLYLQESRAPEGYLRLQEVTKIELTRQGVYLVNDKPVDSTNAGLEIRICNRPVSPQLPTKPETPSTSAFHPGMWIAGWMMVLSALCELLIGFSMWITSRKNKI